MALLITLFRFSMTSSCPPWIMKFQLCLVYCVRIIKVTKATIKNLREQIFSPTLTDPIKVAINLVG